MCFAVTVIFSGQAIAQVSAPHPESQSCRKFAQEFYDWYLPFTKKRARQPAWALALQRKPEAFNPSLLKALELDAAASARAKGDIVGLDFDPFVGSQDPADRYEVRGLASQGEKCSVEVWSASPSDPAVKPDAIADALLVRGHWEFQNFRYPELNSNLATVLAQLREQRRKH